MSNLSDNRPSLKISFQICYQIMERFKAKFSVLPNWPLDLLFQVYRIQKSDGFVPQMILNLGPYPSDIDLKYFIDTFQDMIDVDLTMDEFINPKKVVGFGQVVDNIAIIDENMSSGIEIVKNIEVGVEIVENTAIDENMSTGIDKELHIVKNVEIGVGIVENITVSDNDIANDEEMSSGIDKELDNVKNVEIGVQEPLMVTEQNVNGPNYTNQDEMPVVDGKEQMASTPEQESMVKTSPNFDLIDFNSEPMFHGDLVAPAADGFAMPLNSNLD